MKINKLFFTTATVFAISTNLLFSEAKANSIELFSFNIDGNEYMLKIKKKGGKTGQLFFRKNKTKNKCMTLVFDTISARDFLKCASKEIGKKYIKEYVVNPIEKETSKEVGGLIMAAFKLI